MTDLDQGAIIQAIASVHACSLIQAKALLGQWEHRRGGPSARLSYLLDELAARFPDAYQPFSSAPSEPRYLSKIDQLQHALASAISPAPIDSDRDRWRSIAELLQEIDAKIQTLRSLHGDEPMADLSRRINQELSNIQDLSTP